MTTQHAAAQVIESILRTAGFDVRRKGSTLIVGLRSRDLSRREVWYAARGEYRFDVARKVGKKVVIEL